MPCLGYSIKNACEVSGLGRSLLYKEMAAGNLPAKKVGRRTVILHDDLQKFLQQLPAMPVQRAGAA